jgi:hypothetical protein
MGLSPAIGIYYYDEILHLLPTLHTVTDFAFLDPADERKEFHEPDTPVMYSGIAARYLHSIERYPPCCLTRPGQEEQESQYTKTPLNRSQFACGIAQDKRKLKTCGQRLK